MQAPIPYFRRLLPSLRYFICYHSGRTDLPGKHGPF